MTIYEIGKEIAALGIRVASLERRLDERLRLVNRTGLVALLWIAAILIAAYSGPAAVATAVVFAKLLGAIQ